MIAHAAPVHTLGEHMNDNPHPIYIALVLLIYFLPTILAWCRWHRNEYVIGMLNIFLGWTFIGWVIALVWACVDNTRPQDEIERQT
jgi:UDP-N-acetylmuramyl pentapeptide phosphotransferase/UDP-N-acetylglucosamine-1-phosphate transferase